MINANELRIGNLVLYNDKFQKIYGIETEGFITEFNLLGIRTTQVEHIPLTPEILEKAGFKMIGEKPFFSMRIHLNKTDELCWYSQDKELRYQTIGSGFTRYYKTKYVHQLQNLYFALTGEELPIEL